MSIIATDSPAPSTRWQRSLAEAIRNPDELVRDLQLDEHWIEPARRAATLFPLLVPRSYLRRMTIGNPDDPLLRQVLPLQAELSDEPGFAVDPVGDVEARIAPGVLKKYERRALLISTGSCAVHCRYCFRRHYAYGDEPKREVDWEPAFAALAADRSIDEVILSGGDPLMLTDQRLGMLLQRLEQIPHVQRIRLHSRLPIVLPDRVHAGLIEMLRSSRLTPIMVVHANHPAEIADDCSDALRSLVRGGITVLNQAVLLRGINDSTAAQRDLCLSLINLGVLPYYLHQLDRVQGAAHFEVPVEVGRRIINELRASLPGYAVPRYVQEIAGQPSKTPLAEAIGY